MVCPTGNCLLIRVPGAANERACRPLRSFMLAWPLTSKPPHSSCAMDSCSGSGEGAPRSNPPNYRLTLSRPAIAAILDQTGMRSRAAGAVRRGRSLHSAW